MKMGGTRGWADLTRPWEWTILYIEYLGTFFMDVFARICVYMRVYVYMCVYVCVCVYMRVYACFSEQIQLKRSGGLLASPLRFHRILLAWLIYCVYACICVYVRVHACICVYMR